MSEFADLLKASVATPFRGVAAIQSIDAVAVNFVRAARMVALADGYFAPMQERLLREFLTEIGREDLFKSAR